MTPDDWTWAVATLGALSLMLGVLAALTRRERGGYRGHGP